MPKSKIEEGLLLDFYGELLTKRQFKVLDEYLNDDLSMQEIAEELAIYKSGVNDLIKRSLNQMYKFEEKLSLAKKFKQRALLYDKLDKVNDIEVKNLVLQLRNIESED